MRGLIVIFILFLAIGPVRAQDTTPEEDRGYLQGLIEDSLSTEDTQVRITGFKGSLTAQSSIDRLTVADADGIWLTMTGLVLDWSRTALFARRLEVTELSVEDIVLERLPPQGSAPPAAEAKPFRLPELPVAVDIREIRAEAISLGPTVLGTPAAFSLQGSAQLADGAGSIELQADRIDGRSGTLTIAGGYSNETDVLRLDVLLDEAPDGIAANALKLQGKPSVRLAISGDAPLSDFTARIDLQTDGVQRVTGQVSLATAPGSAATAGDATRTKPIRNFTASLSGDVAPLFAPALAPFFGDAVALHVEGQSQPDGRLQIRSLFAETAALRISGQLDLAADGLPERFTLSGQIADPVGGRVTLPLAGPPATLDAAAFSARFDAATGDAWQASATVQGFSRDGLSIGNGAISAEGTIKQQKPRQITADIGFALSRLAHDDASLAQALGPQLAGSAVLDWTDGTPLNLRNLQVAGAGLALHAAGTLDGFDAGLRVTGTADLAADSIARFSGLAGRDLRGGIRLTAEGTSALLDGSFDLSVRADATDLATGTDRLDPLLAGVSRLQVASRRDETGIELSRLTITSNAIDASAQGRLSSQSGQLELRAALSDLSLLEASLQGDGTVETALSWQAGQPLQISALRFTGAGVDLTASGTVDPDDAALPATGEAALSVADLSPFSALAGRPLSGSLNTTVEGAGQIRGRDFDLRVTATGQDLSIGQEEVDRLLAGASRLRAQVGRSSGQFSLGALELETPALTAEAKSTKGADPVTEFRARLANVALFAPDFPGPASVEGIAFPVGQDWDVSLSATGPGGTTASVVGLIASDLGDVDLEVSGAAPMGLANPFIVPSSLQGTLRYDLRMVGRPDPANLSGQLRTVGSRLSAPTLKLVLTDIDGGVSLSGEQARITLSATSPDGGRLNVDGPVTLRPPYSAGLTATLSQFVAIDPTLYQSTLDGQVALTGPMTGGGTISGAVDVGSTEIQVSPGASVGGAGIPDVIHVNEPAESRRTRDRAGLLRTETAEVGGAGLGLKLDLLVRAPSQIFIRGRGLDAEFGGQLRLAGSTRDVIPIGQFNLIRGRLDLLGKRFNLTEGSVSMQGGLDPIMRLVAETQNDDITSRIVIEGPVSAPDVSFTSDPELPEDEVVAQLLFGRDTSTLSPFQVVQLAGAIATLTGRGGGGVISNLRKGVGLDDLDVSSTESGETQVRVGKYLTDDIYSDVSVDSAGKTEVNLNLDISSRLKVKGRLDNEGDTGIGLYYQRDY